MTFRRSLVVTYCKKTILFILMILPSPLFAQNTEASTDAANTEESAQIIEEQAVDLEESKIGPGGIFERAWRGGVVVFAVLLVLIFMSILGP